MSSTPNDATEEVIGQEFFTREFLAQKFDEKKKRVYKIVQVYYCPAKSQIDELLADGWDLYGQPVVMGMCIFQAVTRWE